MAHFVLFLKVLLSTALATARAWQPLLTGDQQAPPCTAEARGSSSALQSDGILRSRGSRLAGERRPDDAAVLIELHAQRKPHLDENVLDLVKRLAAEVFGLEHFVFALLHELANGLDIRVLEAVVGADRKLELFHGTIEVFEPRIVGGLDGSLDGFDGFLEVDEDAHVVLDELGGQADGVLGRDGAVGPDLEHELFVVGHLAETCGFDGVVDLAHRRVDGVHGNIADGQIFIVVAVGGDVAAAVLDAHFDVQLAAFADGGDIDALIEDGEVGILLDVGGSDGAGGFDVEIDGLGQDGIQLDGDLLEVEDDVGGILDHAGNRGELVEDALDLDGGDGRTLD